MANSKAEQGAAETAPTIIRVSSFAPMRCRAGRQFGQEPTEIALADLTTDELEAIETDPQLKTERV